MKSGGVAENVVDVERNDVTRIYCDTAKCCTRSDFEHLQAAVLITVVSLSFQTMDRGALGQDTTANAMPVVPKFQFASRAVP